MEVGTAYKGRAYDEKEGSPLSFFGNSFLEAKEKTKNGNMPTLSPFPPRLTTLAMV